MYLNVTRMVMDQMTTERTWSKSLWVGGAVNVDENT